jgi:hypothetical protein
MQLPFEKKKNQLQLFKDKVVTYIMKECHLESESLRTMTQASTNRPGKG